MQEYVIGFKRGLRPQMSKDFCFVLFRQGLTINLISPPSASQLLGLQARTHHAQFSKESLI
jgi:hypothetical protein